MPQSTIPRSAHAYDHLLNLRQVRYVHYHLNPQNEEFMSAARWNEWLTEWSEFVAERRPVSGASPVVCLARRAFNKLSLAGCQFRGVTFAYSNMMDVLPAGASFEDADLEGTQWHQGTRFDGTRFDLKTGFLNASLTACDFSRIEGTLSAAQLAVAKISRGIKLPPDLQPEDIVHAASLILRRKPPRSPSDLAQSRHREEIANARAIALDPSCLSPL